MNVDLRAVCYLMSTIRLRSEQDAHDYAARLLRQPKYLIVQGRIQPDDVVQEARIIQLESGGDFAHCIGRAGLRLLTDTIRAHPELHERNRMWRLDLYRQQREKLDEVYVSSLLRKQGLPVTSELIEWKRRQVMAQRRKITYAQ